MAQEAKRAIHGANHRRDRVAEAHRALGGSHGRSAGLCSAGPVPTEASIWVLRPGLRIFDSRISDCDPRCTPLIHNVRWSPCLWHRLFPSTSSSTIKRHNNNPASLLQAHSGYYPIYLQPAIRNTQQYYQPPPTQICQACLPATNNPPGRNLNPSRTSFTLPATTPSHRQVVALTARRPAAGTTSSHHQRPPDVPGATERLASTSRLANQTWSSMVSTSTTAHDVLPWSDFSTAECHRPRALQFLPANLDYHIKYRQP